MKTIKQAAEKDCEYNHDYMRVYDDYFIKAFEAGARFAQEWISVEDEMPPAEVPVIIKTNINDECFIAYRLDLCFYTTEKSDAIEVEEIIGWRPIEIK